MPMCITAIVALAAAATITLATIARLAHASRSAHQATDPVPTPPWLAALYIANILILFITQWLWFFQRP